MKMQYQLKDPYDVIYSIPFNIWFWPAALGFLFILGGFIIALNKVDDGDSNYAEESLSLFRALALIWIWPLWALWAAFRWVPYSLKWTVATMKRARELS